MTRIRLDELRAALAKRQPPAAAEKSEAEYKRQLVAEVKEFEGGYARRVEDKYAVGVLDLIIKLPGIPLVLAEGKIVRGNFFWPTLSQFEEGRKWKNAGVECVLLGWRYGRMYISPWKARADYRECDSLENKSFAESLWEFLK